MTHLTCRDCGMISRVSYCRVDLQGGLVCPVCHTSESPEERSQQLLALAAEGDECAAADLFKEGGHGA